MNKKKKSEPNGYSISSDRELNTKLDVLKRQLGAPSYKDIIKNMLLCPQIAEFLFDKFRDSAFTFTKVQKQAYETEHNVKPSGSYIIVPKRIEVLKNE